MDAFTCKVVQIEKAPKNIQLLGDKTIRPESAQHVIEFPGGAVEVSRTSDGNYWAHILINRKFAMSDCEGFQKCIGQVIGSRIGYSDKIEEIPNREDIYQIAVLIESQK
jgi:hypothetical protein